MNFILEKFVGSEHLIMPISSYKQSFEWFRTIDGIGREYVFSKIWVKDPVSAYWQARYEGLSGHGPHVLADFLRKRICESEAKKFLMLGLSMGGYGSILLGCLCEANVVLAISPQTEIIERRKIKYRLYEKWKGLDINEEELDLRNILEKYDKGKTVYKIFYGDKNKKDTEQAERISNFPNVKLIPLNSTKHTVARLSIRLGILQKHLVKFLKE